VDTLFDCQKKHRADLEYLVREMADRDIDVTRARLDYYEGVPLRVTLTISHPFEKEAAAFSQFAEEAKGRDTVDVRRETELTSDIYGRFLPWMGMLDLPSKTTIEDRAVSLAWVPAGLPDDELSGVEQAHEEMDRRAFDLTNVWTLCLRYPGWDGQITGCDIRLTAGLFVAAPGDLSKRVGRAELEVRLEDNPFPLLAMSLAVQRAGVQNPLAQAVLATMDDFVAAHAEEVPRWRAALDLAERWYQESEAEIEQTMGSLAPELLAVASINHVALLRDSGVDYTQADDAGDALSTTLAALAVARMDDLDSMINLILHKDPEV
jgi:hypothetical protein